MVVVQWGGGGCSLWSCSCLWGVVVFSGGGCSLWSCSCRWSGGGYSIVSCSCRWSGGGCSIGSCSCRWSGGGCSLWSCSCQWSGGGCVCGYLRRCRRRVYSCCLGRFRRCHGLSRCRCCYWWGRGGRLCGRVCFHRCVRCCH